MRLSKMFLPTLKESPSDAEVISHKIMLRAGMVRKVAAGIYNLLPMGLKAVRNVERIVRAEMDSSGAQEVAMPFVLPSELWVESGRWDEYGKELCRLNDRHGREFCLGPTHEEVITDMVRHEVRSYRDLPLNLYQIQSKFRDEIRPRFGLMRGREFIMKDAYSFHTTEECAEKEYKRIFDTYSSIFQRCGLEFRAVEADTGAIGGSFSHEFMVMADTGEDEIVICSKCEYAANTERADIRSGKGGEVVPVGEFAEVSTPGKKTIEEVGAFLKIKAKRLIKTIIYNTENGPIVAAVRGDNDVNEGKLKRLSGVSELALADDETVKEVTGAPVGFAGPLGLKVKLYCDQKVRAMTDAVTGANKADTHMTGVNPVRDFSGAEYGDLRVASSGDSCPRCDGGKFKVSRGIEVGHIFMLGTKYSEALGATFLDEDGKEKPMIMGCYGIGIGRVAAASIEQNNDDNGIVWPVPLAPFTVHIVPVNVKDEETMKASEELYSLLTGNGITTLFDDRDERAGVKFKDADLLGMPVRITISTKTLQNDSFEIKERTSSEVEFVPVKDILNKVTDLLARS